MRESAVNTLIAERIREHRERVAAWFLEKSKRTPLPFYSSVDIRDSGHKIAPVDCNLYPAGFNNICEQDLNAAPKHLSAQIRKQLKRAGHPAHETATRVLILPESHTSNAFYWENIRTLSRLLEQAGFETRLGWYTDDAPPQGFSIQLHSHSGATLTAYGLEIDPNGTASAGGFIPDCILLNNDFSSAYPRRLDLIRPGGPSSKQPARQPIFPTYKLGWHSRKKGTHFLHYNRLAGEFASVLGIDPWCVQVETETVEPVNFNLGQGLDQVSAAAERVLLKTRSKYEKLGISGPPFVFIKSNSGTYGMGVMVIRTPEELQTLNRRVKNKMSVGKNRSPIESVIVQEGIPTMTVVDGSAAEPVIYLTGCDLLGGFLRSNTERGAEENLNSQGMVFKSLCMDNLIPDERGNCCGPQEKEAEPKLELVYGSIARISALAAGEEIAAIS